jgi:hypothetical protein
VAVDGESQLQLYSLRSPWGAPVLSRQRLIHQLGLRATSSPYEPARSEVTWSFQARLRLDGDYGLSDEERDPHNAASYIPGLVTSPVDLSYGYLEASGLLRGTTSVALGRQLLWDTLGMWSLDGAKASFAPGGFFELQGYAGYEQRGGVPLLGTHRYEADGVQRGDRDGMTASQWPSYLESSKLAPAYGASFIVLAIPWLRARADYRRVTERDRVVTLPFVDAKGKLYTFAESRVSSDRLGVGLGADVTERATVDGAYVYDLYRRASEEHRATLVYRPSSRLRVTAGYRYRVPLFDADSIFNWFGARGTVTAESGLTVSFTRAYQLTVTGGARWLGVGPKRLLAAGLDVGPSTGVDGLVRVESSYLMENSSLGSSTVMELGDGGNRLQSDLSYHRELLNRRLGLLAVVGGGRWQHPLLPERSESSGLYVAGLRLFPGARQELSAEWEHVIAEGAQHRFRVTATATVRIP